MVTIMITIIITIICIYLSLINCLNLQELLGRVISLRDSGALSCPHVSFDVLSYSNYALCLSFLSRHTEVRRWTHTISARMDR
jgi:hypothetical protein